MNKDNMSKRFLMDVLDNFNFDTSIKIIQQLITSNNERDDYQFFSEMDREDRDTLGRLVFHTSINLFNDVMEAMNTDPEKGQQMIDDLLAWLETMPITDNTKSYENTITIIGRIIDYKLRQSQQMNYGGTLNKMGCKSQEFYLYYLTRQSKGEYNESGE